MGPDEQSIGDALQRLIGSGKISLQSVHAMTGIPLTKLNAVIAHERSSHATGMSTDPPLSSDESTRLSILTGQLSYGLEDTDDDRIRGIVESLVSVCHLSVENIALLTGVDEADLRAISDDPGAASPAAKYAFAIRGSYLIGAANQARGR